MTLTYVNPKKLHRDVTIAPDQYFYLCQEALLGPERTELINGKIVRMTSQYDRHTFAVSMLIRWGTSAFSPKSFWVRTQSTLQCGDDVPEPDFAVVSGSPTPSKTYMTAERAVLVIEVADSTLLADTRLKPAIYARAGIAEYWVVDIKNRELIVHRLPQPASGSRGKATYASVHRVGEGGSIAPLSAPKKPLKVASLFAP